MGPNMAQHGPTNLGEHLIARPFLESWSWYPSWWCPSVPWRSQHETHITNHHPTKPQFQEINYGYLWIKRAAWCRVSVVYPRLEDSFVVNIDVKRQGLVCMYHELGICFTSLSVVCLGDDRHFSRFTNPCWSSMGKVMIHSYEMNIS